MNYNGNANYNGMPQMNTQVYQDFTGVAYKFPESHIEAFDGPSDYFTPGQRTYDRLANLHFSNAEINHYMKCISDIGVLSKDRLLKYGEAPNYADLFYYMYRLCCMDATSVENIMMNTRDLASHARKVYRMRYPYGSPDVNPDGTKALKPVTKESLPQTMFEVLPRRVEIVGIPQDSKYSLYNSNNYQYYDMLYCVKPGTNLTKRITIETDKQPRLRYREKRKLEGVLEIKDMNSLGVSTIDINKEYTVPRRVFYIEASVSDKQLGYHLGAKKLVCHDGSIITLEVMEWAPVKGNTKSLAGHRCYAVGYYPSEIENKLKFVETLLRTYMQGTEYSLGIIHTEDITATKDFIPRTEWQDSEPTVEDRYFVE